MIKRIIISCMAMLMTVFVAKAENISVEAVTLAPGQTTTVDICLSNTADNLVSFQMDLTLPEGVSLNKAGCELTNRITDVDQELVIGKQAEQVYRLTSTSFNLIPIAGSDGAIITLSLTASSGFSVGEATLTNVVFATSTSVAVNMDNVAFNITVPASSSPNIVFADANVKAICVANWDTNGDGELSEEEAAAVTDLGEAFKANAIITSFNELQYFTGVTIIKKSTFSECRGLISVIVPTSVTTIGETAFAYCTSLTSVTISNSVTSIEDLAFFYCSSLSSVIIPSSVMSIGRSAFSYCSGLLAITVDSSNTVYDSRNNCNAIIRTNDNTLIVGCMNTIIPNTVTSIGFNAFCGCSNLTSITIPNSVTTIVVQAFFECCNLTSITIPSSVTSIGNYAFAWCSGLTAMSVESGNTVYDSRDNCNAIIRTNDNTLIVGCMNTIIPNTVTSIGAVAFYGCITLSSITIPNSVTRIIDNAFYSCGLTSVTVGNPIPVRIDASTFSNRTNATLYVPAGSKSAYQTANHWKEFKEIIEMSAPSPNIVFADANVKAICVANWDTNGDGELSEEEAAAVTDLGKVFMDNKNITSFNELQYFTGLTSIYKFAFSDCESLTSIIIPNSVTSIGSYAFQSCRGLTSIFIPNSVMSIGDNAFRGCSGLTSIIVENGNTIYDSRDNCNAIIETATSTLISGCKNTVIPNSVTSIGSDAFVGCSGLISVVIPNSVTSIGHSAFSLCSGLTSVTISNNMTSIGYDAFYFCSKLTTITIPNSVTSIGKGAFSSCYSLASITVESGNTIYDSRDNCNAIIETATNTLIVGCKNTDIPNSVTSLGCEAFSGCKGLTSITIPNSVTSLGERAFSGCTGLASVTIPNSVTSIGDDVFSACSGLISITVDSYNTVYDSRDNCNAIIETASNSLIRGCKNTVIPNSVTSITNKAFSYCSSLTSIEIPSSVTSIGDDAFECCSGLTSIKISNGVTSIGRSTFSICSSLTSVAIPNSVTSIGDYAFWHCNSLSSVIVNIDSPLAITEDVFTNRANATLYVPTGTKAAYQAADYWSEFKEIIEFDENANVEPGDANGDGEIDVLDATLIIYYILGRYPALNLDWADINGDGDVDILDANLVIYRVLGRY